MNDKNKIIKQTFQKIFDDLEVVLGWKQGFDSLHMTPAFIRKASDLDQLVFNPQCVQNLSGYLFSTLKSADPEKQGKIGICVKGCDSRSLTALIQEGLVERDRVYIVGIPCEGVVDIKKLQNLKPSLTDISGITIDGNEVSIEADGKTERFPIADVLAHKCLQCRYPNPLIYDALIGEPVTARVAQDAEPPAVKQLDALSLEARRNFWLTEMDRCIRCYACRNACPMCVCQDSCIAETRSPKWLSQRSDISEKFLFHMIRTVHLAGRCTECGECMRVCPVDIPVTLLMEKMNHIVKELFNYEAGIDPESKPPLQTYDSSKTGI